MKSVVLSIMFVCSLICAHPAVAQPTPDQIFQAVLAWGAPNFNIHQFIQLLWGTFQFPTPTPTQTNAPTATPTQILQPTPTPTSTSASDDDLIFSFLGREFEGGPISLYIASFPFDSSPSKISLPEGVDDYLFSIFSPQGDKIALDLSYPYPQPPEIYVVPTDGSESPHALNVPGNLSLSNIAFVNNGEDVAGLFNDPGDTISNNLYLVPSDGIDLPRKVNPGLLPGSYILFFETSLYADKIAYVGDVETPGTFELYAVSSHGGTPIKLNPPLPSGGNVSGYPFDSYHPLPQFWVTDDGNMVGYVADQEIDGVHELWVVPTIGGQSKKMNGILPEGGYVEFFWFSWDGTKVAYTADQNQQGVFELFVNSTSGGTTPVRLNTDLVEGGDVHDMYDFGFFRFAPDGESVGYLADQEVDGVVELFIADASGTVPPKKINPEFPDENRDVSWFDISRDSSMIAFIADFDTDNEFEAYVAPTTGGNPQKVSAPLNPNEDVIAIYFSPLSHLAIHYQVYDYVSEQGGIYFRDLSAGEQPRRIHGDLVTKGFWNWWSPLEKK